MGGMDDTELAKALAFVFNATVASNEQNYALASKIIAAILLGNNQLVEATKP